jgi:hypothetical protein
MPTLSLNGYAYGCGGYNGSNVSSVYRYDIGLNSWTSRTSLNTAKYSAATFRMDGFGYVANGFVAGNTNALEEHNPDANTWINRQTSSFSKSEISLSQTYTPAYRNYEVRVGIPAFYAGVGGLVWTVFSGVMPNSINASGAGLTLQSNGYVFGDSSSATTRTAKFFPDTKTAITYVPMTVASYNIGSFALNGLGYIYWGTGGGSNAQVVNPILNTIVNTTNTGVSPGDSGQGCALNGFGLTLGTSASSNNLQFNGSTSVWTTKATTPINGLYFGAAFNGFAYIAGRTTSTGTYRYNDATNSWSASIATLATAITSNFAMGFNGQLFSIHLSSCEKFNDAAGTWAKIATIPNNQDGSGVFSINGAGYVAGGSSSTAVQQLSDSVKQAVLSAGLTVS